MQGKRIWFYTCNPAGDCLSSIFIDIGKSFRKAFGRSGSRNCSALIRELGSTNQSTRDFRASATGLTTAISYYGPT